MLDPKFIRQNPDVVREALKKRNCAFDLDAFLELECRRREARGQIEKLYAKKNTIDQEMQKILKEEKDPACKIKEGKRIKKEIAKFENELSQLDKNFKESADRIPNLPHSSIPAGGVSRNKIIKEEGKLRKFDYKVRDHISLAEQLDIVDFKRGPKLASSNFVLLKGEGARLERMLINFMLDLHTKEHGYKEVFPPVLANTASMRATGQLPNLKDDMYVLEDSNLFLIPTAEVPVTNIHRDEILSQESLPLRYAACTSCFRKEAGSYGKDTKGLVRIHQFNKVELVKFVKPEDSYGELEELLSSACRVIELLEIPYRVVLLSTEEISFAAAKCYDIEIYAPGLDRWLEVSSCSNFEEFQARRGNIRYKDKNTGKLRFVHTLNGSGVALARLVAAILENYQEKDGSIAIPRVLEKYMGGEKFIKKTKKQP